MDDHATSSEIVLPEWGAEVVVLPPTVSNSIDLACGRDASASGNHDIVSPASGSIAPTSGGPTPSISDSRRRALNGGGPLPPSASGRNAPA